jgi:hypothetical protein
MTAITKLQNDFTQNVMGYSAAGIILSTCLGSIAVMAALTHGNGLIPMLLVLTTISICSIHNAAILTLQKPALIFKLLIASVIINTLIIIGGFLL